MELYFLRHGKAEDARPGMRDYDRHLTPDGIAEMRQEAEGLVALGIEVDAILTSPLPRASETAQIVAEVLGLHSEDVIEEVRLAAGEFRLGSLQALRSAYPEFERLMLVGHEPDFSTVAGQLIGGALIDLKKGGLIRIEANRLEPGRGVLRWLLTPRHLLPR